MTRGAEMVSLARSLLADCEGASLAEYALLAATLGVAMLAGTALIQTNAGAVLNANGTGWQAAAVATP
jgi:Flp pilus assembly pilin Flp